MNPPRKVRVEKPEGVLVRQLGRESVLLNLDTESYFGLDDVGARMLDVLVASPGLDEAFATLLSEFDVDPAQLRSDLEAFVSRLERAGLVRVVDA